MCFHVCSLARFRSKGLSLKKSIVMEAAQFAMKPRPGLAIVKFWQGVLEIIIRIAAILLAIATLITSSLALNHSLENLPESVSRFIANLIEGLIGVNYETLAQNSTIAGGLGIAIACLTILYELLVVILRFLNVGLINFKIKIFLIIDIIVSFIASGVFGIAGVLAAYSAYQWSQLNDSTDILRSLGDDRIVRALHFLAALAGASLAAAVVVALLIPWMILFLAKDWNKKVVLATVKDSVFG